ncbi:MAG TPA: site-specific integrase [Acidiferrobacteraceae bacterium]|nr:site-specific integrase [Acidiferrobacteraceae bacterium]
MDHTDLKSARQRIKFTDRAIQALKPQETRYEVWKDNGAGLGIRISPKGRKTWVFLYRFKKKARRMSLGTYPKVSLALANQRHADALTLLDEGIDPGAVKLQERARAQQAPTVKDLADEYMEHWAKKHKRSWKEDQRILDVYVLPHWEDKKAGDIRRRDLILLLDEIIAPVMANRVLACVRKMFNVAVDRDILEATPFAKMKLPNVEKERTRTLDDGEIKKFWSGLATKRIEARTSLALKFLLVTAQRSIEVTQAERNEIDLKTKIWTIPGTRTKNGHEHVVPLSGLAIELLEEVYELGGESDFVFPDKEDGDGPINEGTLRQAVSRNLDNFGIPHFVPHDLRRTASTMMRAMVDPKWVEKVLNHLPDKLERTYDRHTYDAEKKRALEAWGRKLSNILEKQSSNIVALHNT